MPALRDSGGSIAWQRGSGGPDVPRRTQSRAMGSRLLGAVVFGAGFVGITAVVGHLALQSWRRCVERRRAAGSAIADTRGQPPAQPTPAWPPAEPEAPTGFGTEPVRLRWLAPDDAVPEEERWPEEVAGELTERTGVCGQIQLVCRGSACESRGVLWLFLRNDGSSPEWLWKWAWIPLRAIEKHGTPVVAVLDVLEGFAPLPTANCDQALRRLVRAGGWTRAAWRDALILAVNARLPGTVTALLEWATYHAFAPVLAQSELELLEQLPAATSCGHGQTYHNRLQSYHRHIGNLYQNEPMAVFLELMYRGSRLTTGDTIAVKVALLHGALRRSPALMLVPWHDVRYGDVAVWGIVLAHPDAPGRAAVLAPPPPFPHADAQSERAARRRITEFLDSQRAPAHHAATKTCGLLPPLAAIVAEYYAP